MKKVKLTILETFKYEREVIVNVPDQISEIDFENALDLAERGSECADDLLWILKKKGITYEPYDKDFDSPDHTEVECFDYQIIEE